MFRHIRKASLTSVALLLLAIQACSDNTIASPDTFNSAPAAFDASPGTPDWLAPLGGGTANTATFDPTAINRVQVCVWVAGACSGPLTAQFSTTPSAGVGTLTANTAVGRYEATLSLMNTSFVTRKTYRISALRGSTEIRSILVDIVRGRWALTRTDGTLAPLAAATDLPIQFHVAAPLIRVNEVESNGGVPGDWVEIINIGTTTQDVAGFVIKDNDDTHTFTIAAGTTIAPGAFLVLDVDPVFGLGASDMARVYSSTGLLVDSYTWTAHAATTYGRCPDGTGVFKTTTTSTRGTANDCTVANTVVLNEVESNGGTPGDWIELTNTGAASVDISGYVLRDNDDTHTFVIPAGTVIGAGAYLAFDVESAYGLGSADAARLFSTSGALLDSYVWTAHAAVTYGRCPNGTGPFGSTSTSTKGSANSCAPATPPITLETWAGTNVITEVDELGAFSSNASGLMYEVGAGGAPDVLWLAQNGPGSIHRMLFNGTAWVRDQANGWANGKHTKFTANNGEPDTEDLTFTTGSDAGMYIASERDNKANTVSRLSILRYDVTGNADSLIATHEWNLTADIPAVGANLGLEGITWVPDNILVAQGFRDVAAGHTYNPAEYPNHGSGLFFVGVEGNGVIYVYALNHSTSTYTRIASVPTGFPSGVMALSYDRELGQLWATCDNTCGGLSDIFVIDQTPGSTTLGQLNLTHIFARPSNLPDTNNEGFTFAPQSACVGGFKPAFWADDNALNGHSIRRAMIPCVKFP